MRKPRMRVVVWSKRELRVFDEFYNLVPLCRLRKLLPKKSRYSIHEMAKHKGWMIDAKKRDLDQNERAWLKENWPENGLALGPAIRKLNVGVTILRRVGKELGLVASNQNKLFSEKEKELLAELVDKGYSVTRIRDVFYYRTETLLTSQIKKALFTVDKTKLHKTVRKLKCI